MSEVQSPSPVPASAPRRDPATEPVRPGDKLMGVLFGAGLAIAALLISWLLFGDNAVP